MFNFWRQRLKGGAALSPRPPVVPLIKSAVGAFIAIAFVAWLSGSVGQPLILGSLGASCVMLFGFPDLPFSQPRNAIFGHLLTSLVGLVCLYLFGTVWWAMPLALSASVFLMILLRVTHPPAGSNPIIIFLSQPTWSFLIFPTFFGILGIVLIALIHNNLTRKTAYPSYW
jgi:CBS-domain-containing membrane protein